METSNEALAFAESVRRQAIRLVTLSQRTKNDEAVQAAMSLCSQAAQRKRQLLGLPEPDPTRDYDEDACDDGDRYDLATLPAPNDTLAPE